MNPIVEYIDSILKNHLRVLEQKDLDLLKLALTRTYGEKIIGELGEYEFLRNTECSGVENQGKVIQVVTDYLLWVHGTPKLSVSTWGYLESHPLMQFINNNSYLVQLIPECITHYIESQGWTINPYGLDEYEEFIPKLTERSVNIE